MKRLLLILCIPFLFVGCGSDNNPADAGGRPIADLTFSLSSGAFREFHFTLDAEVENGSIDIAVMDENNFQIWQSGNTPAVLYSPGLTPRATFRLPIDTSDTYYLVFSNINGTDARVIKSEIYLFSTVDVGEL